MEHAEKKESPPSSSSTSTRNSRGSLEVFNPSTFSRPTYQVFRPQSSWNNWTDNSEPPENISGRDNNVSNKISSWMALKDPTSPPPMLPVVNEGLKSPTGVGSVAQRAAEWGLVLKTDDETGKLKGVKVRNSGGDEPNNRASSSSRKNSSTSVRSSGDLSDDGDREKGIPRVSKDLKDALSTFQQTFVVSDATKPDYPILYASAGFFKMTGYTSKEVIGRNCRFMQGAETNPEDVGKIREALQEGKSYCGRLLNYKKDGSPFWNLLTISPIKDEHGKTLKFIGMQVEVSKHTEGFKENMLRPNGLPESLIRYDARQKEMASSSVTELVQAVERPETNIRHLLRRSSDPGSDQDRLDALGNQYKAVTSAAPPPRRNSHAGVRISMQPPATAPPRRNSHAGIRTAMQSINELPEKKLKKPRRRHSFMGIIKKHQRASSEDNDDDDDDGFENAVLGGDNDDEENESVENDDERPGSLDDKVKQKEKRKGLDLATTLERIEKNFVITDPRLPDNPIIFASDSFLELTEYSREEILGKNCRFLQGPETDPATVRKIRDAIDNQTEVTVQLINYTKTGKKFWNLFHLQPMRDHKGDVQYFIGVQLDGSQHVEPLHNCIPETTAKESAKQVKETAGNVDEAARELPDANSKPEDLWKNHSKKVHPKPHRKDSPAWRAISKILSNGEQLGLKHFRPIKPLGSGDTGSVHLVELCGTGEYFAMKAMDKGVMLNRNKVHRACAEREILDMLDHPFLPALYASFQTKTHVCLITDYCSGGELFVLLDRQPTKVLKENAVRFFAAEVVVALEYLHCQGIIYRDLKPENILIQSNGHVLLTDFDLSCLTSCKPQLLIPQLTDKKKKKKKKHQKGEQDFILPKKHQKGQQDPIFMAEPMRASNSFVGTEEYIAPEIISGVGHTSAVDWWALGVLLYEMLYGYTPFRGKTRQRTFANVLQKEIKFPGSKVVSLEAKQLIYRLLHKDPKNRLGSREGANEIKQHPFFRGLNWALVRCESPPALDAPLFQLIEEELREVDSGLQELQTNIF